MKKLLPFVFLIVCSFSFAQTRHSAKDLFTETSIVWYGIDYSKAKFIGSFAQFKDAGEINENSLVQRYFAGWNNVIVREPDKYDIAKFFKKEMAPIDLNPVTKVNSETKPAGIMQETDYVLDEKQIPAMVSKYKNGQNKEGLGVVFITESYNHSREQATYYVVVFDIASKAVLITEKYTAKPGGFGIKNYWISTVLKTLEKVSDNYSKWKKTYGV
jgi:hypothetical protein